MELKTWLASLKEADARRPDLPGEHLIVLATGVLLLMATGRSRSLIGRTLIGAAAGAFIGRAASGTGGVARLAGMLEQFRGGGGPRRGEPR
ncbi:MULTISPECIES: hypothetical protein [unclassified Variovorax]|uniref:hypothetical protein n=1 Tax=unclassified Variovorax TaxID=663243 RepID=UPI00076DB4D7|nr:MULTISPECIES: hypothetical protein [unclassified Variovorax]KWT82723.1 hypothetical protein APY03_4828 [Variovorax sp. WDL1]PNG59524.1 hypothetical protein CHC07_01251 [Variovorax sp. B4]PNG60685.1 hypothetical protein CHC06_00584 [Variovorax sp. B2]VTV13415.1 hypothetical protein WDL1CHR_04080 [Variovorax sp. WDL1]